MALNIVTWALAGVVMGALANAARWGIGAYRRDLPQPWLLTLGIGLVAGLVGGIVGTLLFSDLFGLPAALGLSGIAVPASSWGLDRAHSPSRSQATASGAQ